MPRVETRNLVFGVVRMANGSLTMVSEVSAADALRIIGEMLPKLVALVEQQAAAVPELGPSSLLLPPSVR